MLVVLPALLLLCVGYLVITAFMLRAQLSTLQARLAEVQAQVAAGNTPKARKLAAGIPAMGRRARDLTSGPVWSFAAAVPYAGRPLQVAHGTTSVVDEVTSDAIPQLLDVAALVNPNTVRRNGDTIDIAALSRAVPQLDAATTSLNRASAQIGRLPSTTWLPLVDARKDALRRQLVAITRYIDAADRAARVLPAMLGEHGTKRYFIGLQNEGEARGTGGLPGAFAIAESTDGRVRFTRFSSDTVLLPGKTQLIPTGLSFGADYERTYGASNPTSSFQDSNVSPHFPYTAQVWAAMWTKVSGQRVDGVLAMDPTTLSYFLAATGPTPLGTTQLNAGNVVALTERDEYAYFPDPVQRKAFLVAVLKASSKKIISGSGDAAVLLQAASRSSQERRLLIWSRDPAVQRLLAQTRYAGVIPQTPRPFSAVILNNAASGKLDYYVQRSLTYTRTGCGALRDVTATITLKNVAPASGLPAYVTGRFDRPPGTYAPGDTRDLLDYYATRGAVLRSATVNGRPGTASVTTDRGHPIARLDLELPRGSTTTVTLHLSEPAGTGAPVIWRQPGVTPIAVQEFNQSC